MTFKKGFFDLLDHIGPTHPVSAMPPDSPPQNLMCLRHDIDHSLDIALEMAFWEHERGFKATYYLLNSSNYWSDPDFDLKVRQLLDFGHEVGLHVNSLANWLGGRVSKPGDDLKIALERLRNLGADANSIAAHGDKLCYQNGVANFWMFVEEMPFAKDLEPISAEGIPVTDQAFQIRFPTHATVTRPDGHLFRLGSVSLRDHGLDFLAHRAGWDRYFSDSGGSWTRSNDPLDIPDIRTGRTMVLMHPIHWRAQPRQIYVLSPARSGSTWLARVADQASSAKGFHEHTFNHRYRNGILTPKKRTHDNIDGLYGDPEEQALLLAERRAWFDAQDDDVFECNVYLTPVLEALKNINPDATLVGLLRDPRDILVSLLNRGWYEASNDTKHPKLNVSGWDQLTQVEKAAHYIADVRTRILEEPGIAMADLARLSQDPQSLKEFFASLGLAFYPRLAAPLLTQKLNANKLQEITNFAALSEQDQLRATEIIGTDESGSTVFPCTICNAPLENPWSFKRKRHEVFVRQYALQGSWSSLRLYQQLGVKRTSLGVDYKYPDQGAQTAFQITIPKDTSGAVMFGQNQTNLVNGIKRAFSKLGIKDLPTTEKDTQFDDMIGLYTQDAKFDLLHDPSFQYRLNLNRLRLKGLWQVLIQTFDTAGKSLFLKRLVSAIEGASLEITFSLPATARNMRVCLYSPHADITRTLSFASITLDVNKTVYLNEPVNSSIANKSILALSQERWEPDQGAPLSARSLARAGPKKLIWSVFENIPRNKKAEFLYSEGINFTTLAPDSNSEEWKASIEQIKSLKPDLVLNLDNAAPPAFKAACAHANIDIQPLDRDRLSKDLLSHLHPKHRTS